jgi:hypothetical protein
MNRRNALAVAVLLSLFYLPTICFAQEAPYTQGTIWNITFVRVKAGMLDDYLKNLIGAWKKQNEQAKKEGLILSYKVIEAAAANKDDWDLMLVVEFKNLATLDEADAKFRAIASKLATEEEQKKGVHARAEIREIIGGKLGRELILK